MAPLIWEKQEKVKRMAEFTWYHNGKWLPQSQVKPDPNDRGVTLGDQVVDVERTFGGKGFRIKEHIDRLYKSLKHVRIEIGISPAEMIEITEEGISRNWPLLGEKSDLSITQLVTRGQSRDRAWTAGPPNVYVKFRENNLENWAHYYTEGVHGVITKVRSYEPDTIDPKVKHLSRMNMTLAELEANDVDPGAWPILSDKGGNLTEGSGYNVFIVSGEGLRTPTDRAALAGISRSMVMDLAMHLKMPCHEEDLQPYDMYTADEVFFTSTPFSILPVTQVDRRNIGDGNPGPVTQQLLAAWSDVVGMDMIGQAIHQSRAST
jgi:branched-chain amino acid aminotransferase